MCHSSDGRYGCEGRVTGEYPRYVQFISDLIKIAFLPFKKSLEIVEQYGLQYHLHYKLCCPVEMFSGMNV